MRRIEGANAIEIASGKYGFRGRNTAAGLPGTAVKDWWLNNVQEELCGIVEAAGIPLSTDDSDRGQVLKALLGLIGEPYAVDTGAENALVVDLLRPGFVLAAGRSIKVKVAVSSTYNTTIALSNNGVLIGTYDVVRHDGSGLCYLDLVAGQVVRLSYDGTRFQIGRVDGRPGDEVTRHQTGALVGFIRKNGRTIGNAASGATELAGNAARRVYELYWADPNIVVLDGGKGGTAAADWAAGKRLVLPDSRGRVQAGLDDMGNTAAGVLTATYFGADGTVLGAKGGVQAIALSALENGIHYHGANIYDPTHAHDYVRPGVSGVGTGGSGYTTQLAGITSYNPTGVRVTSGNGTDTTSSAGGGHAHPNVQPTITVGIYIRL